MSIDQAPKKETIAFESVVNTPESAGEHLKNLKNLIVEQKLAEAIEVLADIASKHKNEIPKETVDAIIALLSPKEEQDLKTFLEGHDQRTQLGNLLGALGKEVTGKTPEQSSASPTARIVKGIGDILGKFTAAGKIGEFAAKFGFGGEAGKESGFLKNLFVGMAAKITEQIAFMAGKNKKILNTALELRLESTNETDPVNIENFKLAYRKRVMEARTFAAFVPPADADEARTILAAAPVKPKEGYDKESNTFAAKDTKKEGTDKAETKPEKAA